MYPTAVPQPHDVVKVTGVDHHDDLCVVDVVDEGQVVIHHGNNTTLTLPLADVVVMYRPGRREHVE